MLGRALAIATVTLLMGVPARAQNLDAGKSPSQIFSGTCTACHKSPRGLLKTIAPGSLPGFLRQHYTTSPEMAGVLSSYLISNGAADTRYTGGQGKPKSDSRPQGAGPDAAGADPQAPPASKKRHRKRVAKPAEQGALPGESETAIRQAAPPSATGSAPDAKPAATADSAPPASR